MSQPLFLDKAYYDSYEKVFLECSNDTQLFKQLVNMPFKDKKTSAMLGLGVIVLLLVNKKAQTIDRIALSNTEQATGAVNYSVKPFKEIKIPLSNRENYIGVAIRTGRPMMTSDWHDIFVPSLSDQEARFNQAGAGISCSVVYPLVGARDGGAMIFSYYEPLNKIGEDHHTFMKRYSSVVSKSL